MKKYRVEYIEVSKRYASITVEAETEPNAIDKAREFILDSKFLECNETTSQSEWSASVKEPNLLSWFASLWKGDRRIR